MMHVSVFWKVFMSDLPKVPPTQLAHVRFKSNDKLSLQGGSTLLLKASWLVGFAAIGDKPLPRRQDLPLGAGWGADELIGRVAESTDWIEAMLGGNDDNGIPIPEQPVVLTGVSYCWETKVHPDPRREQLNLLAQVARQRIEARDANPCSDLALFFDFCSLYQQTRTWLFLNFVCVFCLGFWFRSLA